MTKKITLEVLLHLKNVAGKDEEKNHTFSAHAACTQYIMTAGDSANNADYSYCLCHACIVSHQERCINASTVFGPQGRNKGTKTSFSVK